jgi:single-strand DNA-binding protein
MQATVVADPELRFTPQGKAVCNVRLVCNDRKKQGTEWVDGDPFWVRATVWERMAENAAETLRQGDQVVVGGRMFTDEFERKDGTKGTTVRLHAFEIAPSLRYNPAEMKRVKREKPSEASADPDKTPTPGDVWSGRSGGEGREGGDLDPPPF